jgi:hypothetical protein
MICEVDILRKAYIESECIYIVPVKYKYIASIQSQYLD